MRGSSDHNLHTVLKSDCAECSTRETAKTFSVKRMSYLFDLDFMNSESQRGYSVDAYNCGGSATL